ncbi:MAG TPA: DUF1552 domain-containing protein [Polyangia bacterium]
MTDTITKPGWRRRQFLRGGLMTAAAIPLLEAERVWGQPGTTAPRRLVVFYTPNGTIGPEWRAKGTETNFTFGRILKPLDPFKSKVIALGGIHMALADAGFGSHHTRGIGGLLTGRPILSGTFRSAGPPTAGWAAGISLDQHIAKSLNPPTPFKTLELGVQVIDAEVRGRISYLGPNQPVPPLESPYDAHDRVFAGVGRPAPVPTGNTPNPMDKLRARRKTVLDLVGEELSAVRTRVGRDDRMKLDAHLQSVQDIGRRLLPGAPVGGNNTGGMAAACTLPTAGARMDVRAPANMPAVGQLQMDVAAAALACDLTRVVTLQWTHAESNQTFPWLGINDFHHVISHAGDGDTAAQEKLTKINVWYAEQLAYLLGKLASYQEGDRTLLDNTVVMWCIEVGKGNNHAHRDLPFLLAGSCGGRFRTGRFLDFQANGAAGRPHNDLLIALTQAMGTQDTTFGDPAHVMGALPGLA